MDFEVSVEVSFRDLIITATVLKPHSIQDGGVNFESCLQTVVVERFKLRYFKRVYL